MRDRWRWGCRWTRCSEVYDAAIARSASDEAIQGRARTLDCFASLAMTVRLIPRSAFCVCGDDHVFPNSIFKHPGFPGESDRHPFLGPSRPRSPRRLDPRHEGKHHLRLPQRDFARAASAASPPENQARQEGLVPRHSGACGARAMMRNCASENPYSRSWLWIPGLRLTAHPGMTAGVERVAITSLADPDSIFKQRHHILSRHPEVRALARLEGRRPACGRFILRGSPSGANAPQGSHLRMTGMIPHSRGANRARGMPDALPL